MHNLIDKALVSDWLRRAYDDENKTQVYGGVLAETLTRLFPGADSFFVTLLTIDEIRYQEGINSETRLNPEPFQKVFESVCETLGGVLSPIRESMFVLVTRQNPDVAINNQTVREKKVQAFITACVFNVPVLYAAIPKTIRKLIQYRGWAIYNYGPGIVRRYSDHQPVLPASTAPAILTNGIIEGIKTHDQNSVSDALKVFYDAPRAENLHNQTMNLLDQLYSAPFLPCDLAESLAERRPALYNFLLDIESVQLLMNIVAQHLFDIENALKSAALTDTHDALSKKIQSFIDANISHVFSIKQMSRELHYSPNYMRSIYKKHTGKTILEYLTQARMRQAEQLLRDRTLTIAAISCRIGYMNPSYFCKQFQKAHQKTPQQYRNAHAK